MLTARKRVRVFGGRRVAVAALAALVAPFILAIAMLSTTGCAAKSYKAYEGPALPGAKTAILLIGPYVYLPTIDGKRVPVKGHPIVWKYKYKIELLPGKHNIGYKTYSSKRIQDYGNVEPRIIVRVHRHYVSFTVEPGHTYVLRVKGNGMEDITEEQRLDKDKETAPTS